MRAERDPGAPDSCLTIAKLFARPPPASTAWPGRAARHRNSKRLTTIDPAGRLPHAASTSTSPPRPRPRGRRAARHLPRHHPAGRLPQPLRPHVRSRRTGSTQRGWFEEPVNPPRLGRLGRNRFPRPHARRRRGTRLRRGVFPAAGRLTRRRNSHARRQTLRRGRRSRPIGNTGGPPGRPNLPARPQRPRLHPGRCPRHRRHALGHAARVRRLRMPLARRPHRPTRTHPQRPSPPAPRPRPRRSPQPHSPPAPRPSLVQRLPLMSTGPLRNPDVSLALTVPNLQVADARLGE